MAIVAVTVAKPHAGKRSLLENRARQLAGIYARHGAKVKVAQIASGPNTGCIVVQRVYADFTAASKAFVASNNDPAHAEFLREREANPAGELLVGRNISRTFYGESRWDTHPVTLVRRYDLTRDKLAAASELLADVSKLAAEVDTNIVGLVPVTGDNMSSTTIAYQFRSIEHFGEATDKVGTSATFQALVAKAAGVGILRSAFLMVPL